MTIPRIIDSLVSKFKLAGMQDEALAFLKSVDNASYDGALLLISRELKRQASIASLDRAQRAVVRSNSKLATIASKIKAELDLALLMTDKYNQTWPKVA